MTSTSLSALEHSASDARPAHWHISRVGDEFDVRLGKMLDAGSNVGELKPYVGNKAVQWGRVDVDDLPMVPLTKDELSRFRLRKGDLLVCEGGEVGRAAIWEGQIEECYYQKALHRLRPTRGFNPRLMLALLEHWAHGGEYSDFVTKTSIAHLPREKFIEMPLPVPPAAEQMAIARVLDDVDALAGKISAAIDKKRDLKQAAMQQFFTGAVRVTGSRTPWQDAPLATVVASLEAGVSVNSIDAEAPMTYGDPCVLKTSAVVDGKFRPEECKLIAVADRGRARVSPVAGAILVSRMNTPSLVGEVAYIHADFPQLFLPDRLWMARLRPDSNTCAQWLAYYLSYPKSKETMKGLATGTSGSMKNISKQALLGLWIPFPALAEQREMSRILSDMDKAIEAFRARRDKVLALKQAMMQQLLTGRIRLT